MDGTLALFWFLIATAVGFGALGVRYRFFAGTLPGQRRRAVTGSK